MTNEEIIRVAKFTLLHFVDFRMTKYDEDYFMQCYHNEYGHEIVEELDPDIEEQIKLAFEKENN